MSHLRHPHSYDGTHLLQPPRKVPPLPWVAPSLCHPHPSPENRSDYSTSVAPSPVHPYRSARHSMLRHLFLPQHWSLPLLLSVPSRLQSDMRPWHLLLPEPARILCWYQLPVSTYLHLLFSSYHLLLSLFYIQHPLIIFHFLYFSVYSSIIENRGNAPRSPRRTLPLIL